MSVRIKVLNDAGEPEEFVVTEGVKLHKADNSGDQPFYLVDKGNKSITDVVDTEGTPISEVDVLHYSTVSANVPSNPSSYILANKTFMGVKGEATSDANASAANILYDKTAYVNGEKRKGSMPNKGNTNIIISTKDGASILEGYYDGAGKANIDTSSSNNLVSGNIKYNPDDPISILGVDGEYTKEDNNPASNDDILENKIAYVNGQQRVGTIETKDDTNITISGDTVTVPKGYYAGNPTTKTIPSGSAQTPDTTIDVSSDISVSVDSTTGDLIVDVTRLQSITPSVTAGYISLGTAGTVTVDGTLRDTSAGVLAGNIKTGTSVLGKRGTYSYVPVNDNPITSNQVLYPYKGFVNGGPVITGSIGSKSAASYDPTSSDQTILSGSYLAGNQTIRGVKYTKTDSGTTTTLDGSVIKKDVVVNIGTSTDADSVVSITGQYEGVEPTGTEWITTLNQYDVTLKKYAQIDSTEADKITANNGGNIVSGVTILGQPGSATVLDAQTKTNLTLTALPYQITPDSPHNGISSATITSVSGLRSGAIGTGHTIAGVDGSYDTVSNASQVCTHDDVFYGKKVYTNGEYIIGTYKNSATIREGYPVPQIYFNRNAIVPQNLLSSNIVILGSKFVSGCAGYELYIPPSSSDVRVSGELYVPVSSPSGDPSSLGYYEVEKQISRYVLTADTTALSGKTYYSATFAPTHSVYSNYYQIVGKYLYQAQAGGSVDPYFEVAEASVSVGDSVAGLYEATTAVPVYQLSTDSEVTVGKTYYQQSTADILVYSSAIKASFLDFESLGLASTDCVVHKVIYSFIDGFISPIAVSYGALAPVSTYLIDNGNVISHIYFNTSLSISDVDTMLGTLLYTEQFTYGQTTYNACILGFADNTRRLVAVQDFLVQGNYAVGWIDGNNYTLVYISNAVLGITTAGWQVDHVDPSSPITINMLSFYPTIWENRCLLFTRAPVVIPAAAGQEAVYGQILAQSWTGGN